MRRQKNAIDFNTTVKGIYRQVQSLAESSIRIDDYEIRFFGDGDKTQAIFARHLFGGNMDTKKLARICDEYGLLIARIDSSCDMAFLTDRSW